ncbi:MAG: hypothetical protein KF884_06780 [Fimbriimonadaceae bacterium]|nr:hypothetical protein [Fimbriimonadaceae bacterium]QYK57255.1 MAG: hypothetical protein KF884_06780 [Fimbriimonadaceae bacterium]
MSLTVSTLLFATMASTGAAKTVRVTQFGAVPNDGRDDMPAFQRALAALPSGGTLVVPAGTYEIDQTRETGNWARKSFVMPRSNTKIMGQGAVRIRVKGFGQPTFLLVDTNRVTFENLTFVFAGPRPADPRNLDSIPWHKLRQIMGWNVPFNYNTSTFSAIIAGAGADRTLIKNCKFVSERLAKGKAAYTFVHFIGNRDTSLARNNVMEDVEFDGFTFAVQASNQDGMVMRRIRAKTDDSDGQYGHVLYLATPSDPLYARWSKNLLITDIYDEGTTVNPGLWPGHTLKFRCVRDSLVQNIYSKRTAGPLTYFGAINTKTRNITADARGITRIYFEGQGLVQLLAPYENTKEGQAIDMASFGNSFESMTFYGAENVNVTFLELGIGTVGGPADRVKNNTFKGLIQYPKNEFQATNPMEGVNNTVEGKTFWSKSPNIVLFVANLTGMAARNRLNWRVVGTSRAEVGMGDQAKFLGNTYTIAYGDQ